VSDDDVLLCYRAEWRRPTADASSARSAMYVSSLWSRRDERWVNVFSQDTPVGGDIV
jgi:hypothetical protein